MEIQVPTNLNDITVEEYQKFAAINTEEADKEFLTLKTLEIFLGVSMQEASAFPAGVAEDLANEIAEVLNQQQDLVDRFELNGVKYGFIPNLEEMTLGEFIDLDEALKSTKDLHKAAAVLFRPIERERGELYSIKPYTGSIESQRAMRKAPIGIVSAGVVFFYLLGNELSLAFQIYLGSQAKKLQTSQQKDSSLLDMVGSIQSMLLATETLPNLKRLPNLEYLQP
jgi:hypothetical protein